MTLKRQQYDRYIAILRNELVPALGCTEPISLAYASARARQTLGALPERIIVQCSGNIIKNVKGVVVPGTGGMRGIETAAILGAVAGDADKELEVLANVSDDALELTKELLETHICQVSLLETKAKLHLIVTCILGKESALVEIIHTHTGIVRIEKNNVPIVSVPFNEEELNDNSDFDCLNIHDIIEFADTINIEDVRDILEPQIRCNIAISRRGLSEKYGANVGSTLLAAYGDDIKVRARAAAAAGSDARMSGCDLPVVINSGSGNQGITVSLPVIEYARELGCSEDRLYRALALSNLTALHQKAKIGRLSAYCGAVSAATGAGAAITYLHGGGEAEISSTIINTLANVAGIVCDGAKPSCAAKIASSVEAAILAHNMTMQKHTFNAGEGIIQDSVENTIDSVSRMARDGMQATDEEILRIMTSA